MALIVVKAAYDAEAGVWFVESSDLPGLNVEASSLELLSIQVPLAVADLIEASDASGGDFDIPIEIISHSSARARRHAAT